MLTHSTAGGLVYQLKAHGVPVAELLKKDGGFQIQRVLGKEVNDPQVRTMKATKEKLLPELPEEVKEEPKKGQRLTLEYWAELCCVSHSGQYVKVKEARLIWPELKGEALVAYLIRKHMEACASWPYKAYDFARRWLMANPELGAYDHAEERRRIEAQYGPQPNWTN